MKKLFLLAVAALILAALPGPARAGDAQRPLQQGDVFIYMPLLIKPPPLAVLAIDNQAGGDVRVDITGIGSHVFPPGSTAWSIAIPAAGWYAFTATALAGPCAGLSLSDEYWLEPGEVTADRFICS